LIKKEVRRPQISARRSYARLDDSGLSRQIWRCLWV